jgi:hypothetical protein
VLGSVVIGPGVRDGDPNRETAVTPAWRAGVWLVSSSASWSWNATADDRRRARREMQSFTRALQATYPESGTYLNEASVDEAHWQRSFWGQRNYARLAAAKVRVDPQGQPRHYLASNLAKYSHELRASDRQIVSVDHGRTMVRGTAGNMCKGERRDGEGERGGINTGRGEPGKGSTWLAWIRGRGMRKGLGLGKW